MYGRTIAVGAVILALSGCAQSGEGAYLAQVREEAPRMVQADDGTLLRVGRDVCTRFDLGDTAAEVVSTVLLTGGGVLSYSEVVAVVSAAGDRLCPEARR
jgi:hypothetical protein